MSAIHQRRIKLITLTLGGQAFECQCKSWKVDPGIDDGDRIYTMCPDGEATEETDPDPTVDLTFFADWRSAGISTYLWKNTGQVAELVIDHHPDITGEHVRWTGDVMLKAPPAGGEARETEETEITLQYQAMPAFEEVA